MAKRQQTATWAARDNDQVIDGVLHVGVLDYRPEYHGPEPVWRDCHGTDIEARDRTDRNFRPGWQCSGCSTLFRSEVMTDAGPHPYHSGERRMLPPPHRCLMTVKEQAAARITEVAVAAGFDRDDQAVLAATSLATNGETRKQTIDGLVAVGVGALHEALTTRSAVEEASRAISALMSFRLDTNDDLREIVAALLPDETIDEDHHLWVDADAPFFSEAVLYPLLGKDAARTLLAHLNTAARATAAGPRRRHTD